MKDNLILRHDKYIAYMQILGGFVITLIAGEIFNIFEIHFTLIEGIVVVNNFVAAFIIGLVGLYFFRKRLKGIEAQITKVRN